MAVPYKATTMATRRGRLPDDLADALLALNDPQVAGLLDAEHRTSAAVRERIARHPNPAMREATRRTARAWIANGTFVPLDMLQRLTDTTGPAAFAILARDPAPKVRLAVARAWHDAPADVRRALLTDLDLAVRVAASQWSTRVFADLHPQLVADPATRANVAEHIALTPGLAADLADDDDENVRIAVAANPHLPDTVQDRLAASDHPAIWANLIRNPSLPEPLRARLNAALVARMHQDEDDTDALFAWAILLHADLDWLRRLPWPERAVYLDSPCVGFRHAIARHDDLPPDAVTKLHGDRDPDVRRCIARRADTPGHILERVVRECGENPKLRPLLVDHPNFPRAALAAYAEEAEPRLSALACRDPSLPAAVVARLSRDEDDHVRTCTAGHPNIPIPDLMRLLGDDNLNLVEAAAASPALPVTLMDQLADRAAGLQRLRL